MYKQTGMIIAPFLGSVVSKDSPQNKSKVYSCSICTSGDATRITQYQIINQLLPLTQSNNKRVHGNCVPILHICFCLAL